LAITLPAAEHHMPGPTLSTHVWIYRAEGPDIHGPTLSTHVWMYRAEGLDFSLAGHVS
jgi:hypothetical protein